MDFIKKSLLLQSEIKRSVRLAVRTPGFHPGSRGSIPLRSTFFSLYYNNYNMANHQSAKKRIRQSEKRRLHNKYYAKTTRNAVRKLRATTEKAEATELFPKVVSMLDKLAKKNVIHNNKAANIKSSLALHVNSL